MTLLSNGIKLASAVAGVYAFTNQGNAMFLGASMVGFGIGFGIDAGNAGQKIPVL